MVIVLRPHATREQVREIVEILESHGLRAHLSEGSERTIIGVVGDKTRLSNDSLELLPQVERLVPIVEPYKLSNRAFHPEDTRFQVRERWVGDRELVIMAGPCAVESEEQLRAAALAVRASGAQVLRGGAYKPRTSPYAFQGLEEQGFILLRKVADELGLLVASEVTSENDVEQAVRYLDIIQIGARNAQNFRLLRQVGRTGLPVLLKRGISETIEEWLGSAEYIMNEGNPRVILCERGIRTFETATRSTLDLSAIPVLKAKSHLPVIVDPSHAAGRSAYVASLSRAAIAAGADGLLVEVHPDPRHALSDAAQQLNLDEYAALCRDLRALAPVVNRAFPEISAIPDAGTSP